MSDATPPSDVHADADVTMSASEEDVYQGNVNYTVSGKEKETKEGLGTWASGPVNPSTTT